MICFPPPFPLPVSGNVRRDCVVFSRHCADEPALGRLQTTVIPPGTLLTRLAGGSVVPWIGTHAIAGVNLEEQRIISFDHVCIEPCGYIVTGGTIRVDDLLIKGESFVGHELESLATHLLIQQNKIVLTAEVLASAGE
jgi:hypothetical protein